MVALAEFARRHIHALERVPGAAAPRSAQCQVVTKIARHGVAAQAGVASKDLLAAVDGRSAARVPSRLYLSRAAQRSYAFHSRGRRERIELAASGIEIGVLLEPTPNAIRATYEPRKDDSSAQETLWRAGEWDALERLTRATLAASRERGTPALLFHGAALCETGRTPAGLAEIREFLDRHADEWTPNFSGVGLYYVACEAQRRGDPSAATTFHDAWSHTGSERMASLIEKATGMRPLPPPARWLQRRFPIAYEYPTIDVKTPRSVALAAALATMSNDQLLGVCLLGSYRSNGPYADFLLRWWNYATYFAPFFAGLHVLTSRTQRHAGRAAHHAREAEVRAVGRPFHLLHERDEAVLRAVQPTRSPAVFLLDRTGMVVYEGLLDVVDVWDVLASVSA